MIAFLPNVPLQRIGRASARPVQARRRWLCSALPSVLVIGGNRGLGLEMGRHLRGRTEHLHTTHRDLAPTSAQAEYSSATHVLDVTSREQTFDTVERTRPEVIVSCFGGNVTDGDLPDFEGNRNLVDAALEMGVRRFMMVSMLGAGDSEDSVPFQVMDTMRPLLLEKSHAERYLKLTRGLEWTVVRPGPLVDEGAGEAVVTEGVQCYGTVARRDLADVLCGLIESERAVGKVLQVVDRKRVLITSPYVRPLEFWEELPFEQFEM